MANRVIEREKERDKLKEREGEKEREREREKGRENPHTMKCQADENVRRKAIGAQKTCQSVGFVL